MVYEWLKGMKSSIRAILFIALFCAFALVAWRLHWTNGELHQIEDMKSSIRLVAWQLHWTNGELHQISRRCTRIERRLNGVGYLLGMPPVPAPQY